MVIVRDPQTEQPVTGRIALSVRVSSAAQRTDLERQVQRLRDDAAARGYQVAKEVTEIASGMNDHRPKFLKLLADPSIGTIIVEHRDRGTRLGWNDIATLMEVQQRRIEAIFPDEITDDLVADVVCIITSMAARISGRRGSRSKTKRTQHCVEEVMKAEDE